MCEYSIGPHFLLYLLLVQWSQSVIFIQKTSARGQDNFSSSLPVYMNFRTSLQIRYKKGAISSWQKIAICSSTHSPHHKINISKLANGGRETRVILSLLTLKLSRGFNKQVVPCPCKKQRFTATITLIVCSFTSHHLRI